MKIESCRWTAAKGWYPNKPSPMGSGAHLVFLFGSRESLGQKNVWNDIQGAYPHAHLVGCSTAGEIRQTHVVDDSLVATAVHFEQTQVKVVRAAITDASQSFKAGAELA